MLQNAHGPRSITNEVCLYEMRIGASRASGLPLTIFICSHAHYRVVRFTLACLPVASVTVSTTLPAVCPARRMTSAEPS